MPATPSVASFACFTRARAWPTAFATGGGSMSWSGVGATSVTITSESVSPAPFHETFQWQYHSIGTPASHAYSTGSPYAGSLLCLVPDQAGSRAGGVATVTGLVVGSGYAGSGVSKQLVGPYLPIVLG